jgi:hypothetical protein
LPPSIPAKFFEAYRTGDVLVLGERHQNLFFTGIYIISKNTARLVVNADDFVGPGNPPGGRMRDFVQDCKTGRISHLVTVAYSAYGYHVLIVVTPHL